MANVSDIRQLRARLTGEMILPNDPPYDLARRVWNHDVDLRPAAIVLCRSEEDIRWSIDFAHKTLRSVAIRSGGHSFAGHGVCENGIVLDLSQMNLIQVNVENRTAAVGPGVRAGELDRATQAAGYAVPLGSCPLVGISGYTLGGGAGCLTPKYGFACDNLRRLRVITADGALLNASTDENTDLFWALRGGGGNFGIVTLFEFNIHTIRKVLSGHLLFPINRSEEILNFLCVYARSIPDDLFLSVSVVPKSGDRVIDLGVVWPHEDLQGERQAGLWPLRCLTSPLEDSVRLQPYIDEQRNGWETPGPGAWASYRRAGHLPDLVPQAVEIIARHSATAPTDNCGISMTYWHGPWCSNQHDNAFGFRRTGFEYWIHSYWQRPDDRDKVQSWVDSFDKALAPFVSGAVYVNDLGNEPIYRVQQAYGRKYERLAKIKSRYDPENFFRVNQNIKPIP